MAAVSRALALTERFVRLEIGIWRSLVLWLARRTPGAGPGVQSFAYAREVSPVIGAFIFVSLIELPVVHLLLPWETVRLIVLVLSVWGLLWMIGYFASVRAFKHLLDDRGMRVRYGTTVDIPIPWEVVASVNRRRGGVPKGKTVSVERGDDGAIVSVAVMKQTRVAIVLTRPTRLELPDGAQDVSEVRCYVDDPAAFVAAARGRLATPEAPREPRNAPASRGRR